MLTNLVSRDIVRELSKKHQISPRARPCLNCHKKMEPARVRHAEGVVEFEHCRKCAVIWFDGGSIVQLLRTRDTEGLAANTPEKILHAIERGKAPKARVAAKAKRETSAVFVLPKATIAIAVVCAIALAAAARGPGLFERFGFLPSQPFRGMGLPWLTSILLNSRAQIHGLAALILFGSFAEKRLGVDRLCGVFLLSGFFANLSYFLSLRATDSLVYGSTPAVAGILGYCLATAPYKEILFPADRLRSPLTTVFWAIVVAVLAAGIVLFWDYFHVAFRQVGLSTTAGGAGGSLLGTFADFLRTASCFAHLCGLAVGVVFGLAEMVAES